MGARLGRPRAIAALPPGSHADTIEFAERAQLAGDAASLSGGSTDLAAALRLAGTLLPRDTSAGARRSSC